MSSRQARTLTSCRVSAGRKFVHKKKFSWLQVYVIYKERNLNSECQLKLKGSILKRSICFCFFFVLSVILILGEE